MGNCSFINDLRALLASRGFSLPEALVGIGVLGIIGVGAMSLSQNVGMSVKGTRSAGDLNSVMTEISKVLQNPQSCFANFNGRAQGSTRLNIVNGKGEVLFTVNQKVGNGAYLLTQVSVDSMDAVRNHARIKFDFKKNNSSKETGAEAISKFVNLFVDFNAGPTINNCLDVVNFMADGALRKMCWDADPLNFDGPAGNDNSDCSDNLANVIDEAKEIYCQSLPFLDYDAPSGTCKPLDAGKSCGPGRFLKGYGAQGQQVCLSLASPSPSPGPTPPSPPGPPAPGPTPPAPGPPAPPAPPAPGGLGYCQCWTAPCPSGVPEQYPDYDNVTLAQCSSYSRSCGFAGRGSTRSCSWTAY